MSGIRESITVTSSRGVCRSFSFVPPKKFTKNKSSTQRSVCGIECLHPLKRLQITLVSLCSLPPQSLLLPYSSMLVSL